jgi:hypothetical protein
MKARERALHVSRLSDRINQSAGKGCRKGLQERAVIGTVQIIIRALIRIYAAVGTPPQAFLDLPAGVGVRPHQALKSQYTRRSQSDPVGSHRLDHDVRRASRFQHRFGVLQVASNHVETNLSTSQNKWISIDSAIKEPQERESRCYEHTDSHPHDAKA